MYEQKYQEAIDELKLKHPELKDSRFEILDGVLHGTGGFTQSEMQVLQIEVNEFLGQKEYRITYTGTKTVYAMDESQAREFAECETFIVRPYISKVETDGN